MLFLVRLLTSPHVALAAGSPFFTGKVCALPLAMSSVEPGQGTQAPAFYFSRHAFQSTLWQRGLQRDHVGLERFTTRTKENSSYRLLSVCSILDYYSELDHYMLLNFNL